MQLGNIWKYLPNCILIVMPIITLKEWAEDGFRKETKYWICQSMLLRTSVNFKDRNVLSSQFVKFFLASTSGSHETRILHRWHQRCDVDEKISLLALWAFHLKNGIPVSAFRKISSTNLELYKKKTTTEFYDLQSEVFIFTDSTQFQSISLYCLLKAYL